jgi:hypothetical protein
LLATMARTYLCLNRTVFVFIVLPEVSIDIAIIFALCRSLVNFPFLEIGKGL